MFNQNPAQAIAIRFAIILFFAALVFSAVHPVFATAELALAGESTSQAAALDLVDTLQAVAESQRSFVDLVVAFVNW